MNTCVHKLGGIIQTECVVYLSSYITLFSGLCILPCCVFESEFYILCGINVPFLSPSKKSKFSNALRTSGCHGNGQLGYKFIFVTSQTEKLRIT